MWIYTLRRLLLLPLTLFCIVLVNFIIINLAPGDPVSYAQISQEGTASLREDRSMAFSSDERYLHFREFYGLTLPILFNTWPWLTRSYVEKTLWQLVHRRESADSTEELSAKNYNDLRVALGDQARFVMPHLMTILENPQTPPDIKRLAAHFFVRGGSRQANIGPHLTAEQKAWNQRITRDDQILRSFLWPPTAAPEEIEKKVAEMRHWYNQNDSFYHFQPAFWEKLSPFFFETRFMRYMGRVLHLDFGTLRNDSSKTVISEVTRRFKYSLTLALLPMLMTFGICQTFGLIMAYYQRRWPDYLFNLIFLILYAIPIFVVVLFSLRK